MKRRLFTLAVVLSLLLCVASIALWVRSWWRFDGITIVTRQNTYYDFYATEGLGIIRIRRWPESPRGSPFWLAAKRCRSPLAL